MSTYRNFNRNLPQLAVKLTATSGSFGTDLPQVAAQVEVRLTATCTATWNSLCAIRILFRKVPFGHFYTK